jgi:hypothetical protein
MPSLGNRDAQIDRRERRPDVRGHVIVAFDRMHEQRIAVAHEAREESFEIAPHVRVGVLLDQQRGGRVLQVQRAQAGAHRRAFDPRLDIAGDFVERARARRHDQPVDGLADHGRTRSQGLRRITAAVERLRNRPAVSLRERPIPARP